MTKLLQALVDGTAVGSLYALIALGYTMVYGILRFINFAHSDIFMLGAWGGYVLATFLASWLHWTDGAPPMYAAPVVLFGAMLTCGVLGFLIERLAYRPLRSAPRINVLITAIGISLLIENVGQLEAIFGTRPQRMPTLLSQNELFRVFDVKLVIGDLVVVGVALALMIALEWLIYRTKLGLAMRAVSHDTRTAALMGIPVDRVISATFVIGSVLAAAAGFLYAQKYAGINQPAAPNWILLGLKCFVAAVVGGIGNVRGAMLGGLLIGLIEKLGSAYLSPQFVDVYVFTLLIVVLLVRPSGILGKAAVEKV
jgi:branched-chain amino acid transport system permease protein